MKKCIKVISRSKSNGKFQKCMHGKHISLKQIKLLEQFNIFGQHETHCIGLFGIDCYTETDMYIVKFVEMEVTVK